jgi:uncharacterized SAM-binding protein YcdF (DUF218 family)
MTNSDSAEPDIEKRIITARSALVLCIALALCAAGVIAFRGAGRWLVREDPLGQADAIVVLSGSMPHRAEGAAEIYGQGYAPEVWVTRSESPANELVAMGIQFTGEEEYAREVLIHSGVPADAVHILPGEIVDTEEEIEEIAREMRNARKTRVIIVTSPQHTRRVEALWYRLADPNQKAIIRGATQDPFDRDHWWRNTRDTYAVVREFLGLANTWTGLPVRPARGGDPHSRGQ